jgi:hypothetical protein
MKILQGCLKAPGKRFCKAHTLHVSIIVLIGYVIGKPDELTK